MDLDLTGRVAVVTGASKGIGLAITTLLVARGRPRLRRRPRAQCRAHRAGRGRSGRVRRGGPRHAGGRHRAGGGGDQPRPAGHPGQQRRGGDAPAGRVPRRHRRAVAALAQPQPDGSGAHHPGRAPRDARAGQGRHRDHQLGQRAPARPDGDRLQRGQGGAEQLLQVAVQGGRAAGRPRQHGQPRTGRHRPVARRATASRPRSPGRRAATPRRWPRAQRPTASPAGSPRPPRSPSLVVYLASDRAANITGADVTIDGGLVTTL